MKLEFAKLDTDRYAYLTIELKSIVQKYNIDSNDIIGSYIVFQKGNVFEKNRGKEWDDLEEITYEYSGCLLKLNGYENYMYRVALATNRGLNRYEPELAIYLDDCQYNYIVIYLTNQRFIISRYGTTEVDYEADELFVYGEDSEIPVIRSLQELKNNPVNPLFGTILVRLGLED